MLIAVRVNEAMQGHWWLPVDPGDRLYGSLEPSDGRWELRLSGRLRELTDNHHVLHGVTLTGTDITVLDAWWRRHDAEQSILTSPAYLEGVHLPSRDEPINAVLVSIAEAVHLFAHEPKLAHVGVTTSVDAVRTVSGPVELPDGSTLEIVFMADTRQDELTQSWTVEPKVWFNFSLKKPLSIPEARQTYVFPTRDFVGYGTQARVSGIETLFSLPEEQSPSFAFRTAQREPADEITVTQPWDRLLQLGFDDDVAGAVARWFGMYFTYRMSITLLLAGLQAREMYGELRLSTVFMAMESFQDKKFGRALAAADRDPRIQQVLDHLHDEPVLRDFVKGRIGGAQKGLARSLGEVLVYSGEIGERIIEALPDFKDRLLAARGRNVAHPGEWNPDGNGLEMLFLYRAVRWIVTTCLLRELGHSEREAMAVVKQCSRFSSEVALFHHLGPDGSVTVPPVL